MKACIRITTAHGAADGVVALLERKMEDIVVAHSVVGTDTAVAVAEVRDYSALTGLLREVNRLEGVFATEVLPEVEAW